MSTTPPAFDTPPSSARPLPVEHVDTWTVPVTVPKGDVDPR
ncbi:hypothetical protein [Streptomyces sp. NPDC056069]